MITRPLDLESRVSRPPRDLDVFFWVNVGVLALFFTLLGSRFVLAPGVAVGWSGAASLPQADRLAEQAAGPTVVVSYRSESVILFEDGIYSQTDLRRPMEAYIKKHPGSVILLRMDGQASVQAFIDVSKIAGELGYANVVLAAEPKPTQTRPEVAPVR